MIQINSKQFINKRERKRGVGWVYDERERVLSKIF